MAQSWGSTGSALFAAGDPGAPDFGQLAWLGSLALAMVFGAFVIYKWFYLPERKAHAAEVDATVTRYEVRLSAERQERIAAQVEASAVKDAMIKEYVPAMTKVLSEVGAMADRLAAKQ